MCPTIRTRHNWGWNRQLEKHSSRVLISEAARRVPSNDPGENPARPQLQPIAVLHTAGGAGLPAPPVFFRLQRLRAGLAWPGPDRPAAFAARARDHLSDRDSAVLSDPCDGLMHTWAESH